MNESCHLHDNANCHVCDQKRTAFHRALHFFLTCLMNVTKRSVSGLLGVACRLNVCVIGDDRHALCYAISYRLSETCLSLIHICLIHYVSWLPKRYMIYEWVMKQTLNPKHIWFHDSSMYAAFSMFHDSSIYASFIYHILFQDSSIYASFITFHDSSIYHISFQDSSIYASFVTFHDSSIYASFIVLHDSFIYHISCSAFHDTIICVTWHIHTCEMTHSCIIYSLMTHPYMPHSFCSMTHSSIMQCISQGFKRVLWHIHMCDVTWHFLLQCVWFQMCDMTLFYVWTSHVTHMNESCHIYQWVMSHICMSHVTHIIE